MNLILSIFTWIIGIHWSIVSIYVLLGLIGYLFYKKANKSNIKADNVELVIVSKASKNVKDSLFNNIKYHSEKFSYLQIHLVIDENSELLTELTQYIQSTKSTNINLTIVPEDFKCNAIAKGRAIEYFIRTKVKEDRYYVYIDDDNLIQTDDFLYEIPYYDKLGYKLSNGILKPRMGRSKLTYVADHLRYLDDMTIFRIGTGLLKKPLNGIHGELLIAKGDLLKEITFNRRTITEDFAFSREAYRNKVKIWQSSTEVSILSPHSIKDFIKQRNRWYKGIKEDIKTAPLLMKIFSGIRIIDWKIGIIGSWLLMPLWFLLQLPIYWVLFNLIGSVYYYSAYIWGVSKIKGFWNTLRYTYLIPFF